MNVFRLSKLATAQLEAIYHTDPAALRELWRVIRIIAAGGSVAGIGGRRGSFHTAPAGNRKIHYRPLASHELNDGEQGGILVVQVVLGDELVGVE